MGKQYKAVLIGHTGMGNYGHGLDMVYSDMPEVDVVAVADDRRRVVARRKETPR